MSVIETLLICGASLATILGVLGGFVVWSTRSLDRAGEKRAAAVDAHIRGIVASEVAPLKRQLDKEFGGNGGGARQALNELHVKVDNGFQKVDHSFGEVAIAQRDLTNRVNTIESQRARRQHESEQ